MTKALAATSAVTLSDALGPSAPLDELDRDYFRWLSNELPLVRARRSPTSGSVVLSFAGAPLIRLGAPQLLNGEVRRAIHGGWLAQPGGEMAFGRGPNGAVLEIRHYRSRLPQWLYRLTQQPVHRLVVRQFAESRDRADPARLPD